MVEGHREDWHMVYGHTVYYGRAHGTRTFSYTYFVVGAEIFGVVLCSCERIINHCISFQTGLNALCNHLRTFIQKVRWTKTFVQPYSGCLGPYILCSENLNSIFCVGAESF
jgi:hypothetical protein